MSREETNKLEYTIALIADFAKTYHIKQKTGVQLLAPFQRAGFSARTLLHYTHAIL